MKHKKFIRYGEIMLIVVVVLMLAVNFYVKVSTNGRIIKGSNYFDIPNVDCVLILGAGVWRDKPSPMLQDRLLEGISVYKSGVTDKMILTGDHGRKEYDEVNIMKKFVVDRGIPFRDVFMDHAGFSTYESMYRAKEIFGVKKVVVVTQKYHLYRALYIARRLGLDAYGVGADPRLYVGQLSREIREILARSKDFVTCIFKPKPTYLGDKIPVTGDGDFTNDD